MSTPDSTDERIVRILGQDARQNSEVLSKQLNLSSATIRRRLRRLINNGALRIIGVINPEQFGLELAAVIAIDVVNNKLKLAMEMLAKRSEVRWVTTTTGRYDIIAMARFPSTDALSGFLTKDLAELPGIKDSETFICLDFKKGHYIPLT